MNASSAATTISCTVLSVPVSDSEIGRSVAALRGDRSQKSIADEMRSRGWRWSQATVWSVEQGTRPLRFAEAVDLEEVLGSKIEARQPEEDSAALAAERELWSAVAELQSATGRYLDAQQNLEHFARRASDELRERLFRNVLGISPATLAEEWTEHLSRSE